MLKSVHIQNFRSCKDVTLEGLAHISALVGRNGAGKTTILRAIEWMAHTALLTDGFSTAFSDGDVVVAFADPRIEVELISGEYSYRYLIERDILTDELSSGLASDAEVLLVRGPGDSDWVDIVGREADHVALTGRGQFIEIHHSAAMMPALSSLLPENDPLQEHLRRVMAVLGGIRYYLGHGMIDPDDVRWLRSPSSPIRKDLYERWAAEDERGGNDDLSLLLRIIHAHQTAPDLFAELKRRVGPEGLGVIRDIRVTTLGDMAESARKRGPRYYEVVFEPMFQSIDLSLSQLSRGTQQMLYLMLALLLDGSSTMLVEQPEDGIHPALLAKLIDLLKVNADPTQIILASHSPTVLSQLQPSDVRLVEMVDGSTRVRALTEVEVSRAQDYMQRDGSLAEFLELIQES